MNNAADQHNRDKSDMLGELNKAIADAEELRKAAAEAARENAPGKPESDDADPAVAPGTVVETGEKKG